MIVEDKLTKEEKEFYKLNINEIKKLNIEINNDLIIRLNNLLKLNKYEIENNFLVIDTEKNYKVIGTKNISKNEILLVDHYYKYDTETELRKNLNENKILREDLFDLIFYYKNKKCINNSQLWNYNFYKNKNNCSILDLRSKNLNNLKNLNINNKELIEIILINDNKLKCIEEMEIFIKEFKNLKLLDCYNNPLLDIKIKFYDGEKEIEQSKIKKIIEDKYKNIEIFNKEFTKNGSHWGVIYTSFNGDLDLIKKTNINQMKYINTTNYKLFNIDDMSFLEDFINVKTFILNNTYLESIKDANRFFNFLNKMKTMENIYVEFYMLDLMWKIKPKIYEHNKNLKYINNYCLDHEMPVDLDDQIDSIIDNIDKIKINNSNFDKKWYILNKIITKINLNSNKQNINIISFKYNNGEIMKEINLLIVIKDIKEGELIYNNFFEDDNKTLKLLLKDIRKISKEMSYDYNTIINDFYKNKNNMLLINDKNIETFKNKENKIIPYKLYTDNYHFLYKNINKEKFIIIDDKDKSDGLILFNDYEIIFKNKNYSNCWEKTIKNKNLLKNLLNKNICLTLDLEENMNIFLALVIRNQLKIENNYWVLFNKITNEKIITNNVNKILRLLEKDKNYIAQIYNNNINIIENKKSIFKMFSIIKVKNGKIEIKLFDKILYNLSELGFSLDKRFLNNDKIHFKEDKKILEYKNDEVFNIISCIFKKIILKNLKPNLEENDSLFLEIDFLIKKDNKNLTPIIIDIKNNVNYENLYNYDKNCIKFIIEDIYLDNNYTKFINI